MIFGKTFAEKTLETKGRQYDGLAAENAKLRSLIKKYGRHTLTCSRPLRPDCICGWDEIKDQF